MPYFPLLSDEACWRKMPPALVGGGKPLPGWARAVAEFLPRTAGAMLVLDYAQRTQSPLQSVLRAKLRWAIAHANRCAYGMAYAAFDLKQAGGDDGTGVSSPGETQAASREERAAQEFVRQLTLDAPSVSDEQFSQLVSAFGEKQTAAMVLLAAYGNFQDRLALALNLPIEAGGPLPPLAVEFAPGSFSVTPPEQARHPANSWLENQADENTDLDPEWSQLSYDALQVRLEQQRRRSSRLPIPDWEQVKCGLPADYPTSRPVKIVWSLVCLGYVPELAVPWSVTTRTHWTESQQDRVFEESLFWVQTRAIRCNYCMGHCEMLLEVAGLDADDIADRTRRLASGDWSGFPPEQQRAFAFARKLTSAPWSIVRPDIDCLCRDLGSARAMYTLWWLCRGLYMTRVSDGFQLTLERENVFAPLFPRAK